MLIGLFESLRRERLPVTVRELLDLHAALRAHLVFADLDAFYHLARTVMVKDERHFDRFDRGFAAFFKGMDSLNAELAASIPDDWLRRAFEREFSEEERARIEALGGLEQLLEEFRKRLAEQTGRHQGGNRWIGTGGTSPFGNGGYNPEGIRVGGPGGNRRAVKVWERREYRNLDDQAELGTRNIKLALRRLRRFARQGAADELDIDSTIEATARDAGLLDIRMRPERHNAVKVLLLLDIGGSMDEHVRTCEELFSACRSEFKHLQHYYFHNCLYDAVWKDNNRRWSQRTPTLELLRTYGPDWRVVLVGDASMAPYEITAPGGSVEHINEEPGSAWITRLTERFPKLVWINPSPQRTWDYTVSTQLLRQLVS
ncbi:MAG: VWA domain-containing protein, partial [Xanthomonadaceae bacterium]|nr:VWA domain-containing protein [Xanthomonadaceae bacterium]